MSRHVRRLFVVLAAVVVVFVGSLARAPLMARSASAAVAAIGAYWFVERVFFG